MDIKMLRVVLLRCFLYGMVLLLLSFLMYCLMGDFAYRMHAQFFHIKRYTFDKTVYLALLNIKLFIFTFFLIPYMALSITFKNNDK